MSVPSVATSQVAPPKPSASSSGPAAKTPHGQLVEQAQKWVAQTFYGTLLKHMHDSPFKSKIFDGGRGGQVFSSLLDQRLADHMGRSSGSKLVNSIVRRIEASKAYAKNDAAKDKQAIPQARVPHSPPESHRRHGQHKRSQHHSLAGKPSHLIAALTQG